MIKHIEYEVTFLHDKKGWITETRTWILDDGQIEFINYDFDSEQTKKDAKLAAHVGSFNIGLYKIKEHELKHIERLHHLIEWYGKNKIFEVDYDKLTLNVFKFITPIDPIQLKITF